MIGIFAAVFCLAFILFNLFSLGLLGWRCRFRKQTLASRLLKTGLAEPTPPVSIVRPVCGLETYSELTLRSTFELDYPDYEVLFCVQKKNDPIIPLLEKLVAGQPEGRGRILIGDDPISPNPKLNNCFKGWQAAKHQFIVLADSNVLAPKDYLQQMLVRFTPTVGLVCSPPLGVMPEGVLARLECSLPELLPGALAILRRRGRRRLRPGQEHDVAARDRRGGGRHSGPGFGNRRGRRRDQACARRRHDRHAGGSPLRPTARPAHACAPSTSGRRAGLACAAPASRPCMRRKSSPASSCPSLAGAYAARDFGFEPWTVVALVVAAFVIPEYIVNRLLRWPGSLWSPLGYIFRDLLFAVIWIDGWLGDDFVWLGNSMTVREASEETVDAA